MAFALRPEDYYHTGIVVPDLDAAMARLSALVGYEWINPLTYTLPFRTVSGTRELTSTFVYSLQSPHVELIQQVAESPWTAAAGNDHSGRQDDVSVRANRCLAPIPMPQVGAAFAGALLRGLPPPGLDASVVAGQQHLGDVESTPARRPGVRRAFQNAVGMRIVLV